VRAVCSEAAAGEVVEAVNLNSPGQVVIAGNKAAVERAMVLAKEKGAKRALPLPVSVPSHSSLMLPAAEKLLAHLQGVMIAAPAIPVLHNTDVQSHTEPDAIRAALAKQLHTPVRWVETVQALKAASIERVIECGPGKVLAGLASVGAPLRQKVLDAIAQAAEAPRASERSSDWVGYLIADVLGLDIASADCPKGDRSPAQNAARAKVRTLISAWLRDGTLLQEAQRDARNGRDAPVIVVSTPPAAVASLRSSPAQPASLRGSADESEPDAA
ncbi:MAG: ACP S-malonyltransferase, partial [Rhodobacteraceae bacterium]|nr:ACP S-malonyltransferase [Paracoccaceae bacterium]